MDIEDVMRAMKSSPSGKDKGGAGGKSGGKCGCNKNGNGADGDAPNGGDSGGGGCINLSNAQVLIIAGIIAGVLEVDSVLVDQDQHIEVVLIGFLKRKTCLDKVMEQVSSLPFQQVFKAIMDSAGGD